MVSGLDVLGGTYLLPTPSAVVAVAVVVVVRSGCW